MEIIFSWVDAIMIISVFIVIGLVTGKNQHDKRVEQENVMLIKLYKADITRWNNVLKA